MRRARGPELRRRFGAHSIGIGRKRVGGRETDELALIVYVERKGKGPEAVPVGIEFKPKGLKRPVLLPTDVVETPEAEPEA